MYITKATTEIRTVLQINWLGGIHYSSQRPTHSRRTRQNYLSFVLLISLACSPQVDDSRSRRTHNRMTRVQVAAGSKTQASIGFSSVMTTSSCAPFNSIWPRVHRGTRTQNTVHVRRVCTPQGVEKSTFSLFFCFFVKIFDIDVVVMA